MSSDETLVPSADAPSAEPAEAPSPDSLDVLSVEEQKRNVMREVVSLIAINGGRVPETEEEFWYQVGLTLQMAAPRGNAAEIARRVLETLGIDWDEEYVEEDQVTPSLQAYEILQDRIQAREAGEGEEAGDDEDTSGALARERDQILVLGQDYPIQAIVQFIEDGTFILNPEWQRGYVWQPRQRKRFIESIFLGLPIPPVLLFQDRNKKIYVIDGRQRLETVYRFWLGSKDRKRRFKTFDKKTPGWGESGRLQECANKYFEKLPEDWQRHFNTYVIPARLFRGMPRRTLYEVFRRYNTGAVKLQAAEIRNAVYQGAPLHDMLLRIAGEKGFDLGDPQEKRVARMLWPIMKKRTSRYGAYNFVGRCLAFAHVAEDFSVAAAINKFMDDAIAASADPEPLRKEFLDAFDATLQWYDSPLSVTDVRSNRVIYHEWVATIQIVSTIRMLQHVRAGRTTEHSVQAAIQKEWSAFVEAVLQDKQNTSTHWGRQREWIKKLKYECGVSEPVSA